MDKTLLIIAIICIAGVFSSCSTSNVAKKQEYFSQVAGQSWAQSFKAPVKSGNKLNVQNAVSLAKICHLASFEDKGVVAKVSEQWGLEHLFVDLRDTDSQYILVGNSNFTVLAYRATESRWQDIKTNLKHRSYETLDHTGVYGGLPEGAAGYRENVADCFSAGLVQDIKLFRRATGADRAPFFITGHSLGGALATITRGKLEKEVGLSSDSLYTFGAPVSISDFGPHSDNYRKKYKSSNFFFRFENDNVPRISARTKDYSPSGNFYQIDRNGSRTNKKSYQTLNFFSSLGWSIPWLTGIVNDHSLVESYIPALESLKQE